MGTLTISMTILNSYIMNYQRVYTGNDWKVYSSFVHLVRTYSSTVVLSEHGVPHNLLLNYNACNYIAGVARSSDIVLTIQLYQLIWVSGKDLTVLPHSDDG